MRKNFSIEEGLSYQKNDLSFWQGVLKPEIFELLKNRVEESNEKTIQSRFRGLPRWAYAAVALCGDDVLRGNSITQLVLDIANEIKFPICDCNDQGKGQ